ncbi:recombinase family protein [Evtepia sp.]|uniref:recombinase family protein n=1 Tax=Evtepia sp. TaxID=2773933 RepID=UPI002A81165B|nr:recombinase family protein [Evtepia sp.]MDY4429634.1 recombinase family protein [Evtepia sp.]
MKRTNQATTKKAVAYMRYSSDNQNETSIEYQRIAIEAYCDRNGIELVGEYVDEAYSGTNDKRPGFQDLIRDALDKPEWGTVLVHDFSRFTRNITDAVQYKNMLRDRDFEIISVTENLGHSFESLMLELIIDMMNAQYSHCNARATMAGMKVKARKAGHCGGIPALGYDLDENGQLMVNEEEAEAVRAIFDMAEQEVSYRRMAEYLNSKGFRTKSGNPFTIGSFNSILHQEKYTGTYIWNRTRQKNSRSQRNSHAQKPAEEQIIIDGGCPQIISPEQFWRVQKKLAGRAGGKAASKARRHYMLGGLKILRCAKCGAFLVGNPKTSHGRSYTTYSCPNHRSGRCATKDIRTEYVDNMVVRVIVGDLYNREDLSEISRRMSQDAELKKLEDKKRGVEKEIGNLVNVLQRRYSESLLERLDELEDKKKILEQEIQKHRTDTVGITRANRREVCEKLAEYLVSANDPAVRTYLQKVLDEISVSNEDVMIKMNIA